MLLPVLRFSILCCFVIRCLLIDRTAVEHLSPAQKHRRLVYMPNSLDLIVTHITIPLGVVGSPVWLLHLPSIHPTDSPPLGATHHHLTVHPIITVTHKTNDLTLDLHHTLWQLQINDYKWALMREGHL